MTLLKIENLEVKTEEKKEILKNINMNINSGEIIILFGPNGSGKTSLLKSIIGLPNYKKTKGRILFNGKDITEKKPNEIQKEGIALAFQNPPEIKGVKLKEIISIISKNSVEAMHAVEELKLKKFLERDINVNFSGGEKKRAEILQLLLMEPKLLLVDEPDSGVDIESMKLLGKKINDYVKKKKASAIIITHQGEILKHVKAKKGYVMLDGEIICSGNVKKILRSIKKNGYERCMNCKMLIKK